ncbi:DNA replication initiation control protein YabA [Listeria monocytogenes]|uniref:Replication initiation control protein YabA n=7 Tax=Listeria monocytogenes TaxID=1639 RepID=YABA_LISMO|nr:MULTISPECIES: DNA replication initiation control protein YabA [Listeria]NP_463697.1 DNA replication intiation control protein YabA [Listeria monocytogenes EGD-e]B8DGQ7.1 RecName: Full=Initiation-control protein YabA [Listeria monocytogenes HCC23]Q8YAG2.1 RecName: Full=Initiation-control protein YabA [Listeria monocytogenes EGD-e]EAA0165440.1 DNA replication initiation control protein YabA [Listeria monocytogenes serotype 1/2a]EAD3237461.1 DNA replication initiation control protein YabA [Lis
MDKKAIFDSVSNMEEQIGELYQQLGDLKTNLGEMLEENNRLNLENEHLRRRLSLTDEATPEPKAETEAEHGVMAPNRKEAMQQMIELGEGYDNLVQLYKEGFHVCNVHFGSPRGNDEDCLFCLSLLNKK